jgi:hypothetical protein
MPEFTKNPMQNNPWGGSSFAQIGTNPLANIPMNASQQQFYANAQGTAPPPANPQQAAINNVPNANAIGTVNGTGEPLFPNVPDYLGQAGAKFNNFQPTNLGQADLSNAFSGFDAFQSQLGQGPQIRVDDIISGQQQNQMLNSAIGANSAQRQTAERDAMSSLGGRGFTSESPALQATKNRLGLNEALANTQARVDIPMQANRQNADYRLQATQANLGQRNADVQNFVGMENAKTGRISPLLSALVGLV